MLVLFRFLAKYDFSYEIVYDDLGWPWSDKPVEFLLERADKAVAYLQKQWVDKIIIPPIVEMAFHHEKKYADLILPLWMWYAQGCLSESPVGKIGLAGEYADLHHQNLFEQFCRAYQPNEVQQQRVQEIAKRKPWYEWSLSIWRQEIVMRKYYITKLGFKNWQIHHAMKADWKYFKDAGVDTIIPTSYGFFAYEVPLAKFLNTKKQRFHRLSLVENVFDSLVSSKKGTYSVGIHYTGTLDHLMREKKWIWMLQRGKEIVISSDKISL